MNNIYWIYEDKFIFKPEFNEPIDNYVDVIKNYSQLIFSNYDVLELYIDTNNDYEFKYSIDYKGSIFNYPLTYSLNNLTLTHLTFGWNFNQPLSNSLNKLTSLCLFVSFNENTTLEKVY